MMKPSFKFSSIQSSNERIEASQFSMVIFECEVNVQIGEVLTCTKCSCEAIISSSTVQRFTSCRNYMWGDSSKHFDPNIASAGCLHFKISWGSMPPDHPSLFIAHP